MHSIGYLDLQDKGDELVVGDDPREENMQESRSNENQDTVLEDLIETLSSTSSSVELLANKYPSVHEKKSMLSSNLQYNLVYQHARVSKLVVFCVLHCAFILPLH